MQITEFICMSYRMSTEFRGFKFCDVKNRLILKNSKVLNFVELFCGFLQSWSKHFEPPLLFIISINLYGFGDQGCYPQTTIYSYIL